MKLTEKNKLENLQQFSRPVMSSIDPCNWQEICIKQCIFLEDEACRIRKAVSHFLTKLAVIENESSLCSPSTL